MTGERPGMAGHTRGTYQGFRWSRMSYDSQEGELRQQLVETAVRTYRRGMVAGSGGNVSLRVPGRDEVLITPTGLCLELTTPESLVKVDLFGMPTDPVCAHRPSRETGFHCSIYRLRRDVNAIVHTHPPYATAFSIQNRELPLATVSAGIVLGRVPCVPAGLPGSTELCREVERVFASNPSLRATLMQSHGIIAVGPDLVAAYDVADLVEATAQVAHLAAILGIPQGEMVELAFRPIRTASSGPLSL